MGAILYNLSPDWKAICSPSQDQNRVKLLRPWMSVSSRVSRPSSDRIQILRVVDPSDVTIARNRPSGDSLKPPSSPAGGSI